MFCELIFKEVIKLKQTCWGSPNPIGLVSLYEEEMWTR